MSRIIHNQGHINKIAQIKHQLVLKEEESDSNDEMTEVPAQIMAQQKEDNPPLSLKVHTE